MREYYRVRQVPRLALEDGSGWEAGRVVRAAAVGTCGGYVRGGSLYECI